MNVRLMMASFGACLTLFMPQAIAQAQSVAVDGDLQRQLQRQETRIQELEERLSQANQPQFRPASATANSSIVSRLEALEKKYADEEKSDEPEWVDVSEEKWSHKWGGRIMGDYVLFADQDQASLDAVGNAQNFFEFRRLRFFVQGEGYGVYDYKLQIDFEPEFSGEAGTAVRDAYVGIHELPFLGYLRFGNFKEPFSLEELTSSRYITFMERSLPVGIWAPARKVGVASYNRTADEDVTLTYGAFFNDIDAVLKEKVSDRQGIDLAARATWNPIYANDGRHVVHTGSAIVWSDQWNDELNFSTRPEVHEGVTSSYLATGTFDADHYFRYGKEAAVVWGPLSLQSELFYTHTHGAEGQPDNEFWGAYAYASYFLTGENRNYSRSSAAFGRVKPFTNFFMVPTSDGLCTGWGAWETAVRWSWVQLDDRNITEGTAGQLNDVTLGVNWYWNPYTRLMFNYITALGDRNDVGHYQTDILGMRLQVDF